MKHHRSLYLIYLILFTINSYHCNQSDELRDEQENSIIKSESEDNFQQPKTGPVNLEIIGDTSHLFKEEDFEKKEAILLSINHDYINNNFSRPSSAKKTCTYSSANQDRLKNSVKLVNGSELTKYLSDSDETECFLVLFYVPWCPFSARLAPIYNALPRAFLSMSILAFDVSNSVGYNTKFGTSAVPMVILFQHKNVLARMNCTGKTLPDYIEFVGNMTSKSFNFNFLIFCLKRILFFWLLKRV